MFEHHKNWKDKLLNYFNDINYKLDGEISDIKRLDLSNKNLNYLPKELVNLTKLEALNLKDNNFTEIPDFICKMKILVNLDFSNNNITKISNELIQYYMNLFDESRFDENLLDKNGISKYQFPVGYQKLVLDGNNNLLFTEEQLHDYFSYNTDYQSNWKFTLPLNVLEKSFFNILGNDKEFQFYMKISSFTTKEGISELVKYLYKIDFTKDNYSFKEYCWIYFSKTKSDFFNLDFIKITNIQTFEFVVKQIDGFNNLNKLILNFSSNNSSLKDISLFRSIKELEIHVDLMHEAIGQLKKLEILKISTYKEIYSFEMNDSNFFNMPKSIENLLKLKILIFTGAIPKTFNMKYLNLSTLIITHCPIINFPKWIKNIKISTVQLYNCQLFELTDESIERIREVSNILLTNCLIPSIPNSIKKLKKMIEFRLEEIDFPLLFRKLPDTIVKLNNLESISIASFSCCDYINNDLFLLFSQEQYDWLQNLKSDGCKIKIHKEEINLLECFKSQNHNFAFHDDEPWVYNYILQGNQEGKYYIPDTIEELYKIESLLINIKNYSSAFIPQVYSLPNLKRLRLYIQEDNKDFFIYKKLKTLQEHNNIDVIEIESNCYELPKQIRTLLNRQGFINYKKEYNEYNNTFIFSK